MQVPMGISDRLTLFEHYTLRDRICVVPQTPLETSPQSVSKKEEGEGGRRTP